MKSNISSLSSIDRLDSLLTALKYLKAKWESFSDNVAGMLPISANGPMTACAYYKLNNNYGCAIFMSYYMKYPAFIRLYNGEWTNFIRI